MSLPEVLINENHDAFTTIVFLLNNRCTPTDGVDLRLKNVSKIGYEHGQFGAWSQPLWPFSNCLYIIAGCCFLGILAALTAQ